jgi:hypothetical protein
MRPVTVVGSLIEADAVCTRRGAHATGLFVSIELEVANQVTRVVVKVGEMLRSGLLQRHCMGQLCANYMHSNTHPAAASHPTLTERAKTCPRHSSGVSRRPADVQGATRGRIARPDSAAPGAFRLGTARFRRGAGKLRSVDPFPWASHPLMGGSAQKPLLSACAPLPARSGASAASVRAVPLVM